MKLRSRHVYPAAEVLKITSIQRLIDGLEKKLKRIMPAGMPSESFLFLDFRIGEVLVGPSSLASTCLRTNSLHPGQYLANQH